MNKYLVIDADGYQQMAESDGKTVKLMYTESGYTEVLVDDGNNLIYTARDKSGKIQHHVELPYSVAFNLPAMMELMLRNQRLFMSEVTIVKLDTESAVSKIASNKGCDVKPTRSNDDTDQCSPSNIPERQTSGC